MNDENDLERAKTYRAHAEEIRSVVKDIRHPESRAALLRLVTTYERLATKLESDAEMDEDR